ncbi:TetR/AcrR family transcriptional regulator [Iamia sp.]|jgi:AcrR family transcriptional regulator|uniref:TetR/AcrR family transcriptional regulator n=1 Tax=Iamia sp. TaxID=2722710 RepID=UPI002B98F45F|nr:TetR/AcrR family transcriptional regulator [Iamia sp.]HXH57160.1 TetR/AcrR family transcriptional regulator [Iamia sp.]
MTASTHDRLVEEGMRLFAAQGYRATTVADIQHACGLAAGSGALYKHFTSKQDLLEQGMRRFLADLEASGRRVLDTLPSEPRAALGAICDGVWSTMAGQSAANRIILRDLEQFPELLDEVWTRLVGAVYAELTDWLRAQRDHGNLEVVDPQATAAVLLSSLTYHRLLGDLIGRAPGDVEPETFANAWIDHAVATLGLARPVGHE